MILEALRARAEELGLDEKETRFLDWAIGCSPDDPPPPPRAASPLAGGIGAVVEQMKKGGVVPRPVPVAEPADAVEQLGEDEE